MLGMESVDGREKVVEDQYLALLVALTMDTQAAVGKICVIPGEAKKLSTAQAASGKGEQNSSLSEVARRVEHGLDLLGGRAGSDAAALLGAVYEVNGIAGGMAEANGPLEET